MFERFTERARHVVVLAQESSSALKHGHIGTEHLLLGLLREEVGLAARALDALGVTEEDVHSRVVRDFGVGSGPTPRELPFTPAAKRGLEGALRESLARGHNYIGTEHILLGIVESDDAATRILGELGADAEAVRRGDRAPSVSPRLAGTAGRAGFGRRPRTGRATGMLDPLPGLRRDPSRSARGEAPRHVSRGEKYEDTLVCGSCGAGWDVSMDVRWRRRA